MKYILVIGLTSKIGGIETSFREFYNHFNHKQYHFDFATINGPTAFANEFREKRSKIFILPDPIRNPLNYYVTIKDILKKHRYDIIHINMLSAANILPIIAAKKLHIPIILHSHNGNTIGLLRKTLHRINRPFLDKEDFIKIACSKNAGDFLFHKSNYTIINNSVNYEKYKFNDSYRQEIRTMYKVENSTVLLGAVGRLAIQKNPLFILEVLLELKRITDIDIKLIYIGNGSLKKQIIEKAKKLGVINNILFADNVTDPRKYYSALDLFLMPSLFEGLSMASLEAQTSGLQCIFSRAITKNIDMGNCTFLELNPRLWASTILDKRAKSPHRKFDKKRLVAKGFDANKNTMLLKSIYDKVLHTNSISEEEQKQLMLDMLKFVDQICRKNNIKYSLIGGSLIGAIRHQGYIPWDDDIDIILTKENYTKLKNILDKQTGRYQTLKFGEGGEQYSFTKLIDTKTNLTENGKKANPNYGVFLDIFYYHKVSNNKRARTSHYRKLKILYKLISRSENNSLHNEPIIRKVAKSARNIVSRLLGYKRINRMFEKLSNKYENQNTDYLISNWPLYGPNKEFQLAKNTEGYIDAKFENLTVMIFKNYDAILRTTFGDYMQLPPESERIPKHSITAWWREENE